MELARLSGNPRMLLWALCRARRGPARGRRRRGGAPPRDRGRAARRAPRTSMPPASRAGASARRSSPAGTRTVPSPRCSPRPAARRCRTAGRRAPGGRRRLVEAQLANGDADGAERTLAAVPAPAADVAPARWCCSRAAGRKRPWPSPKRRATQQPARRWPARGRSSWRAGRGRLQETGAAPSRRSPLPRRRSTHGRAAAARGGRARAAAPRASRGARRGRRCRRGRADRAGAGDRRARSPAAARIARSPSSWS